jgi:hypothetical protein
MPQKRKQTGKLFISYRRGDARGIAGRLSDTLGAYFGDQRVFRDIESIEGGADFGNVIEESLQTADAVIVLIGPDWLTLQDDNGQRRIDDPQDWVAQEIAAAMQLKKPVFPVLVENASMPRGEELPDKLKPLTRYNAISISDDRWKTDVERLAKIISFEIPSASERKLYYVNLGVSFALFASLTLIAGIALTIFSGLNENLRILWVSVPFIVILSSSLILLSIINLIDEERRRYIHASIATGAIGCFLFFILWAFQLDPEQTIGLFGAIFVGTLMLAFMNLSGFKAK